jgi:hypothetical protein
MDKKIDEIALKEIAEVFKDKFQRRFNVHLDYSIESLKILDHIIAQHYKLGPVDEIRKYTVFEMGAYVGEVLKRKLNGKWQIPESIDISAYEIIFGDTSTGLFSITPFCKVGARFENGMDDSLFVYSMAIEDAVNNPESIFISPTP